MNEYVESIVNRGSAQGFRTKYRTADMLLIDDIQFLQRKEGTQEEFFNTFNELHMNSNQIVMTSDRTPNNLENLEVRLRSRFQSGMVAEIGMPQYEMRIAILRQKCRDQGFDNVPDDVLSYVAEVVETNIRELGGHPRPSGHPSNNTQRKSNARFRQTSAERCRCPITDARQKGRNSERYTNRRL